MPWIDCPRVVGPDVADDEELFGQPALGIEQRKVLLVGLHRQDQALGRHGEELGVEAAQQHVGPLDQGGHFVEQRRIVDRRQAFPCCGMLQLAQDLGVAVGKTGGHRALAFELLRVMVGVLQRHRFHQGLEPVAVRGASGRQPEHR